MQKKKSSKWTTVLLIVILIIGLSLLLYPTFSNWWNSMHQSRVIASYTEQVSDIDNEQYAALWQDAWDYNHMIAQRGPVFTLTEEETLQYQSLLDVGGTGIMGYVEIPSINVLLPIYHGTDEAVLQVAVGHLEWTSLPVGGENSHCVISSHRGLPSARLFTDLDQLEEGNTFSLRVLDEVLTYQIDQIRIVEPHQVEDLLVVEGMDYCTLVTCTPYGVNSHRMLVRGHRIDTIITEEASVVRITADAVQIEPFLVAPVVAVPMLLLLLALLLIPKSQNNRRKKP